MMNALIKVQLSIVSRYVLADGNEQVRFVANVGVAFFWGRLCSSPHWRSRSTSSILPSQSTRSSQVPLCVGAWQLIVGMAAGLHDLCQEMLNAVKAVLGQ